MTIEMGLVLLLALSAVALFITEKLSVDLVALIILSTLLLSGILTPAEGLSGLSNPATVTVGAMFILSAGLFRTGAVNFVALTLGRLGRISFWLTLVAMMVGIGVLSAFINNTAAVAVLLPVVLSVARAMKRSPSRLLMPLSFASMFGGVCTLIGTSTNILVSSIAEQHGMRPFGMFEFSRLGIILALAGLAYMLLIGVHLIPDRRGEDDLTGNFELKSYLTEVVLEPAAKSVGRPLAGSPLLKDLDVDVVHVTRGGVRVVAPPSETILAAGDVLTLRCSIETIRKLQAREGVVLTPHAKWEDADLESEEAALVEAVVAPSSAIVGRTLAGIRFRERFGATVLALRQFDGGVAREQFAQTPLRGGDSLLVQVRRERLGDLRDDPSFVLVNQPNLSVFRKHRIVPAVLIVAAAIGLAAAGVMPIVVTAVVAAVLLVLTGCLTPDEAYRAVEWKVIFLLAGILPLGLALERTGAAQLLAGWLIRTVGEAGGPLAVLAALYLLTSLLTEAMSNNATAALLAPIAIGAAAGMGIDPRPLLMAVCFAASSSFMTPVGYQTNTMIYGPGRFRFRDFVRVGLPLNILFWVISMFLIPRYWSFSG